MTGLVPRVDCHHLQLKALTKFFVSLERLPSLPLDPEVISSQGATLLKVPSDLETRRSQLRQISDLPPELLSEIFLIIAAHSRVSADHPGYLSSEEIRLCTKGVCRSWRSVALGCPGLWSYIDFASDAPERVKQSLELSKAIPLVVQASLRCRNALCNVLLALEYTSRIQSLDLGFLATHFSSFKQSLLKPAPALQVLRLNCADSEVTLPPTIFAGQVPRLRELELRGCAMPKASHLLRNLTYLSVDELPSDSRFTVIEWLEVLDSLPLLEVLALARCFSSSQGARNALPSVQLPELFSISLEGCIQDCGDILSHLVFPPTPCLEITCNCAEAGPNIVAFFSSLLETIGRILRNIPPAQKLRAMGMSWRHKRLIIRASTDEKGDVSPDSEDYEFCLTFVPRTLTFSAMLAVLDVLPTSDIAALDLAVPLCRCPPPSHWIFSSGDDWAGLLRRFPAVHTLHRIQYDWAAAVLTLLAPEAGDERSVVLPALHTLGFVNTAFDIPAIVPSLMKLLQARTDNGTPIKTITAHFCTHVRSKMHMLVKAGVDVQWDGTNTFESEEKERDFLHDLVRPRFH